MMQFLRSVVHVHAHFIVIIGECARIADWRTAQGARGRTNRSANAPLVSRGRLEALPSARTVENLRLFLSPEVEVGQIHVPLGNDVEREHAYPLGKADGRD